MTRVVSSGCVFQVIICSSSVTSAILLYLVAKADLHYVMCSVDSSAVLQSGQYGFVLSLRLNCLILVGVHQVTSFVRVTFR